MAWEGDENPAPLQRVKSTILKAAVMVANYKTQIGKHAAILPGFSRGEMTRRFDGRVTATTCGHTRTSIKTKQPTKPSCLVGSAQSSYSASD
jgi:hypothetical protein